MADDIIDLNNIENMHQVLDRFSTLTQSVNSFDKANSNILYGLNMTQNKAIVNENRDKKGYVFFTRPQLNMQATNLRNVRQFYNLLTKDPNTIHRYIRCMLDPRQMFSNNIYSPIVDNTNPFIPILTNTIKTVSGWPDITMPTFTSAEGLRKEQMSMGDGTTDIYEAFDIDCTFRNTRDEPLMLLFQTWVMYIGLVFEGVLMPYFDMIVENEIDYNTRIYRLIMDESNTIVKKIAAVGASFPVNVPTGKFYDYNDDEIYNMANKEVNIRFKCNGAMYEDPILIKEFNMTNCIFNSEVRILIDMNFKEGSAHSLVKIPNDLLYAFNYRATPIINTNTFELEWWISKYSKTYQKVMKIYEKTRSKL